MRHTPLILWLLAHGLLLFIRDANAQGIKGQDDHCSGLQMDFNPMPRIVVNAETLQKVENDFQLLIDCLPARGELNLDVKEMSPHKMVVLHKSITIRSDKRDMGNNTENEKVDMQCPKDGLFEIRSGGVIVSDLRLHHCESGILFNLSQCNPGLSDVTISHMDISEGIFDEQTGAIVAREPCNVILDGVSYSNNIGRALTLTKGASGATRNCLFQNNSVLSDGGAIWIQEGVQLHIESSVFINNSAAHGAVLYSEGKTAVKMEGNIFISNTARKSSVIYIKNGSILNATDCSFANNTGSIGSAVDINETVPSSVVDFMNCNFTGNNRRALLIQTAAYLSATRCIFKGNGGFNAIGGAIAVQNSTIHLAECVFEENEAANAGVIYSRMNSSVVASKCNFTNNNAAFDGGVIVVEKDVRLSVKECNFFNNTAGQNGGVMYSFDNFSGEFTSCTFEQNRANVSGGAISILTPLEESAATNMNVYQSRFYSNTAGFSLFLSMENQSTQQQRSTWGGAVQMGSETSVSVALIRARGKIYCQFAETEFIDNNATNGGAISSAFVTQVSIISTNFTRNSGADGGAFYIKSVGDPTAQIHLLPENYVSGKASVFNGNEAYHRGGALFLLVSSTTASLENAGISPLDISNLTKNGNLNNNEDDVFFEESSFTGNYAATSGGAWFVERGRVGCRGCKFIGNSVAKDDGSGGAICLMDQAALHGRSMTLDHNRANRGAAVFSDASLIDIVHGKIDHNVVQEGGGGFYIHIREGAKFRFGVFARINVSNFNENMALVGGGLYISIGGGGPQLTSWEAPYMVIVNSSFTNNIANASGGAIFTYRADVVDVCRIPRVDEISNPTFQARSGVQYIERLKNASLADGNTNCLQTWIGNQAINERGGNVTAGIAIYVKACNASSSCSEDGLIVINNHTSGTELSPFSIELMDQFGNIAWGQPRMRIQIIDFLDAVLPNQEVRNIEAMTNVTGIRLLGKVGNEYNLTLSFEPKILDDLSLLVRVGECLPGEVPDGKQEQCLSCPRDFYSFNPTEECRKCPSHAKCSPSTITPEDGYWHSKSDSTNIQQCASQRACRYENREHILEEQAWKMHHIKMILNYTDNQRYRQCNKGHHGVLCGACDETHGKMRSQECHQCKSRMRGILLVFLLAVWYTAQGFNMMRNAFASNSVMPNILDESGTLCRRKHYASEMMKILVSFFQTTSVALTMNVEWTKEVSRVLGIAGFAFATGENFFSLECAFSAHDSIPRSIQRSVLSLTLPIMVVSFFWVAWIGLWRFKGESASYLLYRLRVTTLSLLHFFYFSITENALRIFVCASVNDDCSLGNEIDCQKKSSEYWMEDTDVKCWEHTHLMHMLYIGLPSLAFVSFGLPFWLLVVLRSPKNSLDDKKMSRSYGFLYNGYDPRFVRWEVIILLRKAFVAAISVYAVKLGPNVPGHMASGVNFCAAALHSWLRPFTKNAPNLNVMEMVSICTSFFVFSSGILFNDPEIKKSEGIQRVISVFVVMWLASVVIYFAINLIIEIRDAVQTTKAQRRRLVLLCTDVP